MSWERELTVAREAALEAAALVKRYRASGFEVDRKAGNEPVTIADREASDLIWRRLHAAFPADGILSEEVPDDGARLRHSRVWMIDPIDGTSDFIAGDDGFCVMIGLVIDGRPQLGVLAMPASDEIYTGAIGEGAFLESPDGGRRRLETTALAGPPGIRLVASKTHRTGNIDAFRKALAIEDEINVGSIGVKVSLVANASRDLYVYPGSRTKLWDSAAPEAILIAAGGRFTDIHGRALSYTSPELMNRGGLVASNGPLHDRVIDVLQSLVGRKPLPE